MITTIENHIDGIILSNDLRRLITDSSGSDARISNNLSMLKTQKVRLLYGGKMVRCFASYFDNDVGVGWCKKQSLVRLIEILRRMAVESYYIVSI